jgi:UDP-N-acetylglucosamine 2-epimerase
MRIATIIGTRPQFVKAAPMSRALAEAGHDELRIHTGQHYDSDMSGIFFQELSLPAPHVNLGIGSGSHGAQTGRMLTAIEEYLLGNAVDAVLVYGDTNSTLAGALCACKLGIPLLHVEAGLRSFNRSMPEEHNRVLTDHCSDLLFCPTQNALRNLKREGLAHRAHVVGDLMLDAVTTHAATARERTTCLNDLGLKPGEYSLLTLHRAENTGSRERLSAIVAALGRLNATVVFPIHPRTRNAFDGYGISLPGNVLPTGPSGYLDMLTLTMNARCVLTDSGGLQKEAFWLKTPCITLRDETEWTETVEAGWNQIVGASANAIVDAATAATPPTAHPPLYGEPGAAVRITQLITTYLRGR